MARYTGPSCKLCRRAQKKLFLKGSRCVTEKCAVLRKNYPPGLKGQESKIKVSDYGLQLREKQNARAIYGILEGQFRLYFATAVRQKGITGDNLLVLLERRLDNVIFRAGWAESRAQSRQFVRHNHVLINGRRVNIPSCLVNEGDVVSVKEKSRELLVGDKVKNPVNKTPIWLKLNSDHAAAQVLRIPKREDIDTEINENLIVALYSK
ncbi:MAG: 30S ribosomal protein S4 [Firmicutes bacterium HGW-Firmicutes-13]|nr:MAG: 30S ribosomal protein S4 [Firmicutes bacterium HGW-Firmicutes-13]